MNRTKAAWKTIGEVEKLTGISKRELKYFIEQRIICLSQKSTSGYWLYDEGDIQRTRLASLCRKLDFPVGVIRMILNDPDKYWKGELEKQIERLNSQRDSVEMQVHLAKLLQNSDIWEALRIYSDSMADQGFVSETDIGKIEMIPTEREGEKNGQY